MPIAVTGSLLPALIGFIAGIVTPFLTRYFTFLFLGPKLQLQINLEEVPAVYNGSVLPQFHARVRVRNTKLRVARQIRGYVTRIERVESHEVLLNESFPLIWSYDASTDAKDLPQGPVSTIDVASYQATSPQFELRIRSSEGGVLRPTKFSHVLDGIGTYRYSILVTGHSVRPEKLEFEVTFDGVNWPPTHIERATERSQIVLWA